MVSLVVVAAAIAVVLWMALDEPNQAPPPRSTEPQHRREEVTATVASHGIAADHERPVASADGWTVSPLADLHLESGHLRPPPAPSLAPPPALAPAPEPEPLPEPAGVPQPRLAEAEVEVELDDVTPWRRARSGVALLAVLAITGTVLALAIGAAVVAAALALKGAAGS